MLILKGLSSLSAWTPTGFSWIWCWWAGSSRTRRELSLLCSSREGPRPLLLWNKGRFSRRKVSIFSDPWYSLTPLNWFHVYVQNRGISSSLSYGCDSITSTLSSKGKWPWILVCYLLTRSFRCLQSQWISHNFKWHLSEDSPQSTTFVNFSYTKLNIIPFICFTLIKWWIRDFTHSINITIIYILEEFYSTIPWNPLIWSPP